MSAIGSIYDYIKANGQLYTSYDDIARALKIERAMVPNLVSKMILNERYTGLKRVALNKTEYTPALGDPILKRKSKPIRIKNLELR